MKIQTAGVEKESSSRNIFINLGSFQFISFLRRGVFYTFMIPYLKMLMGTVTWTAALGTLNAIGSSLGQNLIWGKICDRFKVRTKLIVAGETIAAFTYIVVFLVHRSLRLMGNGFGAGLSLILGLSILEFFWSMSDVGWAALLTDMTTMKNRGRTIGTMNFVASLGRAAGILYAGFLYSGGEGFMNGTIFYIVIALLFAGVALMTFTSIRISRRITLQSPVNSATDGGQRIEPKTTPKTPRKFKWFLISLIIIIIGVASISQIFILFVQLGNGLHASDPEMSLIINAWTIGGMFTSLTAGRLADRLGRIRVLLAGLVLAIITPLAYSFASSISLMALVYGVNGVSFWIIQTVGFVFAGDLVPNDMRGRLLGRYNAVMTLSWGPAGFLIGGPIADAQVAMGVSPYTAYINVFLVASAITVAGTVLFVAKIARARKEATTNP